MADTLATQLKQPVIQPNIEYILGILPMAGLGTAVIMETMAGRHQATTTLLCSTVRSSTEAAGSDPQLKQPAQNKTKKDWALQANRASVLVHDRLEGCWYITFSAARGGAWDGSAIARAEAETAAALLTQRSHLSEKTNTATAGTYRSNPCPPNAHVHSQVDGQRHPGRHSQHPTTNPTDPKCPQPHNEPIP